MTAIELLELVESRGVNLAVEGAELYCEGEVSVLTPELIEELRGHKSEILFLMRCGQCETPLAGPLNKFWRVLLDTGLVYLCSTSCVFKAWPWRMEVADDNRH
jgi:hypothetical protein